MRSAILKPLQLILLFALMPASTFGQALVTDLIPSGTSRTNSGGPPAPGFRYQNPGTWTDGYYLEIHFRIDSAKFDSRIGYRCGSTFPIGAFLWDNAAGSRYGHNNIVVGGNQQLCLMEQGRRSGGGLDRHQFEFPLELDTCYVFVAERVGNVSTVSLNGQIQTYTAPAGDMPYTWENRSNGVTVAKESQNWNEPLRADSWPGTVSYVNDNGFIIDDFTNGVVEGTATVGTSQCDGNVPPPPPPPPPGPCDIDPNSVDCACDIDPNSVDCACEINPHPACDVCTVSP